MDPKTATEAPTVTSATFRQVVGRLATGVTIVTTTDQETAFGMTASSVTSLSADPPMMIACLNNSVPTAQAVGRAGKYAVNVLHDRHSELAQQFAMPSHDKFKNVRVSGGVLALPLIEDALAQIECVVEERVVGGTHTIFIGRVVSASAQPGEPLTYFRGGFGRFEFIRDDEVYRRLRDMVLRRAYQYNDVLAVEALSDELQADASSVFYALTRLAAEGLVKRDPTRGHVVTPFDVRTSDGTFDARLAIELGVIELVVGAAPERGLTDMRRNLEIMSRQVVADRFVDFEAYLDANYEFHRALVNLAENAELTSTFEALAIRTVMTRGFGSVSSTSQRFIDVQKALLEALELSDKDAARKAATAYSVMAKNRVREILQLTGGHL